MFKGLLNMLGSKKETQGAAAPATLTPQSWAGDDAVNCSRYAEKARARARYELAREFHIIGADWYGRNVVGDINGVNTPEQQERFENGLRSERRQIADYECLIAMRETIIEKLKGASEGIDRKKLSEDLKSECGISTALICNQMERGGWIKQEKVGSRIKVLLSPLAPVTDLEFMKNELPKPGSSGMWEG